MRRHLRIVLALLTGFGVALGCAAGSTRLARQTVKEPFEGTIADINDAFWLCWRPENSFEVSQEQARSGHSSLKLSVQKLPLFAHLPLPPAIKAAASTTCLRTLTMEEGKQYLSDDAERAELRENKNTSPRFGDDVYYGFSMFMTRDSAPLGDFNRMVVGQWKSQRPVPGGPDSPFLALRMTGGFFHIMLGVEAVRKTDADFTPDDCKLLLAYTGAIPPNSAAALPLTYPVQCESRLNYDFNQGQAAPPGTLQIDRYEYLPDPVGMDGKGAWIDLIFHVKSGPSGVVEVWANGRAVAKATGWIGYVTFDHVGDIQYFKFGPYRDPAGYDTVIYLDNLSRGTTKDDVDPGKF